MVNKEGEVKRKRFNVVERRADESKDALDEVVDAQDFVKLRRNGARATSDLSD